MSEWSWPKAICDDVVKSRLRAHTPQPLPFALGLTVFAELLVPQPRMTQRPEGSIKTSLTPS